MVTVQQLRELNSKIDKVKEKNATALAELNVLQKQLDEKAKQLSEILGIAVTPENIEALYAQAQTQLSDKAARIEELLNDLQGQAAGEAPQQMRPMGTPAMNFSAPLGFTGQAQQMVPQSSIPVQTPPPQPASASVTPNFANFGTGTTFQI